MIPFLYSFLQIIGNLVYIKKCKDAKRFQIFKLKIAKGHVSFLMSQNEKKINKNTNHAEMSINSVLKWTVTVPNFP